MASPEDREGPAQSSTAVPGEPFSRVETSIVPMGTVQRLRAEVEARITPEVRERDDIVLLRAQAHASYLRQSHRSYGQRLRVAAEVGLINMSPSLARFVRDHDNMVRAVARSDEFAWQAQNNPGTDTLTYVNACKSPITQSKHVRPFTTLTNFWIPHNRPRRYSESIVSPLDHHLVQLPR